MLSDEIIYPIYVAKHVEKYNANAKFSTTSISIMTCPLKSNAIFDACTLRKLIWALNLLLKLCKLHFDTKIGTKSPKRKQNMVLNTK